MKGNIILVIILIILIIIIIFRELEYEYRQFILTPTQYGIPNSRPRYYLIAIRRNQSIQSPQSITPTIQSNISENICSSSQFGEIWRSMNLETIYDFIPTTTIINESLSIKENTIPCQPLSFYLLDNLDEEEMVSFKLSQLFDQNFILFNFVIVVKVSCT